ncbi:MAG: hypothetical protein K5872_08805 [Rhizobiaceae bacterium]|nr:hypothetical protein [Rhizobiaceae bacterium]MCV0406314.1 hypothetical protein [Rhizobiaceae bacterium]
MLKWLASWITGDVASALTKAYVAAKEAKTESERIAADVEIKRLEDLQAARKNANEVRLATANFIEMRVITALIAFPFVAHLWGVWLDTQFGFSWSVSAFPPPFNEWQGAILLSFFGLSAGVGAIRAVAGAFALRGRR